MKKRLLKGLTVALCALFGSSESAQAQITGISLDSLSAFTQTNCLLPSQVGVNFSGNVLGTISPNDSVTIYLNWGDGSDTTFKEPYTTGNWYWGFVNHTYTIAGSFSVMGVATTSNSLTDTFYANTLTLSNTCSPLSGRLYVDANTDCIYQTGEVVLSWASIKIHDNANNIDYYTSTNNNGQYYVGVPPGNYTISVNWLPAGITASCPASGSVNQVVSTGSYVNNFAFTCSSSSAADMSVTAYAGNWRYGFDRPMGLHVMNNNACVPSSCTLTVTLPAHLSYSGVYPGAPAPTVSGNTLTWVITNFTTFGGWHNTVLIHCATTATMFDTLCVTATITPTTPDANPANNTYVRCAEVNNSFDPNDKSVAPAGTGPQGYILNGTPLTYRINFQNTGNDVAYTVTVKDLIDTDLDLSSMRVLNTSHPMKLTFNGRQANFRFDNINLPDSGSNEPESHGYILYTIRPNASLASGIQIHNTADIYFDYNDAIVTNTTLNTIGTAQNVQYLSAGTLQASVYPNPSRDRINIELNNKDHFRAELMDLLGRNVRTLEGAAGKASINVAELAAGTYLLKLTDDKNQSLSTKVNVQH